jgi:predicted metal-binding protein
MTVVDAHASFPTRDWYVFKAWPMTVHCLKLNVLKHELKIFMVSKSCAAERSSVLSTQVLNFIYCGACVARLMSQNLAPLKVSWIQYHKIHISVK